MNDKTDKLQERIGAQMSEIASLKIALRLILETKTNTDYEGYVWVVRYIAENALKATEKRPQ